MKRFMFAVAVVALSACVSLADDKPATGGDTKPATPAATATTGATVEYAPAQAQRRGLLARLRGRNTTTYSAPIMTTPAATPMPTPGGTTPTPMPGTKPASGTTTTGGVVQASGNLPAGRYTTTDGTIIQVGGTQPMTTSGERRGLFSRLRSR